MTIQPRRLLKATNDVKVMYDRMLVDEFATGGFLAGDVLGDTPAAARKTLLLAMCLVRYVNGRQGYCHIGMSTLAEILGHDSNNHKLTASLRLLLKAGLFTQMGTHRRAPKLAMSLPEKLHGAYEELAANTTGDLITVTDIRKPPATQAPPPPDPPPVREPPTGPPPGNPWPVSSSPDDDDPWAIPFERT
jgi:hypothetical protein